LCSVVSSVAQFDGYGTDNANYSYCESCDVPTGELAETVDYLADGFPVEPRALWYGNNEPGYVRYFKRDLGLSPVDHPACPVFAFFEQVRDPFVRPRQPSFCR